VGNLAENSSFDGLGEDSLGKISHQTRLNHGANLKEQRYPKSHHTDSLASLEGESLGKLDQSSHLKVAEPNPATFYRHDAAKTNH
jgi:hypothetical protein